MIKRSASLDTADIIKIREFLVDITLVIIIIVINISI
jgi:hypothetical protein